MSDFNFGYDNAAEELILWKRGRRTEVARIPLDNVPSLMETMAHVLAVRVEERNATEARERLRSLRA